MDDLKEFIAGEKKHIVETIALLNTVITRNEIGNVKCIAISTMIQNIYTGMESILRAILMEREVEFQNLRHGTKTCWRNLSKMELSPSN